MLLSESRQARRRQFLRRAGLVSGSIAWLSGPRTAMAAIVLADVWKTTPFVALIVLAGLQGISHAEGTVRIGAGTPFLAMRRDPFLLSRVSLLPEMAATFVRAGWDFLRLPDKDDYWTIVSEAQYPIFVRQIPANDANAPAVPGQ